MNLPRQFYGVNYISRLFSNFQDDDVSECPKLCFHEICDVIENPLPVKDTYELGMSATELSKMLRGLVTTRSCCLDGLGIARGENVICSGYRQPYSKKNPHITNSTCKTVTAIAVMFALSERLLGIHDTVLSFFPEYNTLLTPKRVKQMTIEHLLTMTSGSKCTELTAIVEEDWVQAFLMTDCHYEPGTQFIYNSMNSYMLSAILTKVTEMSLLDYLKPRLFEPLGINNVSWELCPKGIERGGWGLHMSLDGMLKIGIFLANDGMYHERQLIDAAYIRRMKSVKIEQNIDDLSTGYGYQLWHLPNNLFMLSGMYGQHVIVDDVHKLVIATNAHNDKMFPDSQFTKIILACMNSEELYQPKVKRKETAFYKKFTQEFQAFCNGWNLPKMEKELPYKLYCRNQERRILEANAKIKEICTTFDGKCLHIDQATFQLFSYMMRGMYRFPPFAVTDIAFKVTEKNLEMCFVKDMNKGDRKENKTEKSNKGNRKIGKCVGDKLVVKAGFARYCNQTITVGFNPVHLAAKVYFSTDEDGNDVMQLYMVFPATGFGRKIKFFLLEDRISIECMEYPDMRAIVEQVLYGETVLGGNTIDLTGKLPEGLRLLLENKVETRVNGSWIR